MQATDQLSRSERVILDTVRRHPGITRAALTAHTEVTQQSVHRQVDTLAARGLVTLSGGVARGRGKPSPGVTLVADARFALGVSVNTDAVQLVLSDLACREVARCDVDTDPGERAQTLADLARASAALMAQAGATRDRLLGVGFAVSGFRNGRPGQIVAPVPLSDWSNVDLRPDLAQALGVPAWLENNATSGAIGEAMVGAGLRHDSFAYLSFNYGFGGGIVSRGAALAGGFGNAGELSSLFTEAQMPHRPALGELMKRLRCHGVQVTRVSDLARRYDPDWPGVEEWLDEIAPQLNLVLRALRAIVDPCAIVFGGEAPPDLRARMIARCETRVLDRYGAPIPAPDLINSDQHSDPAAFGASLIPLRARMLV